MVVALHLQRMVLFSLLEFKPRWHVSGEKPKRNFSEPLNIRFFVINSKNH